MNLKSKNDTYPNEQVFRALKKILLWTLADAFVLQEDESIVIQHRLDTMLSSLEQETPKALPLPVKRELETGIYSRLMKNRDESPVKDDGSVKQASSEHWSAVLSDMVTESYDLSPFRDMTMAAEFAGLLIELGVGDPYKPRASKYLPNAVKHKLNARH